MGIVKDVVQCLGALESQGVLHVVGSMKMILWHNEDGGGETRWSKAREKEKEKESVGRGSK